MDKRNMIPHPLYLGHASCFFFQPIHIPVTAHSQLPVLGVEGTRQAAALLLHNADSSESQVKLADK